MFKFRAFSIYFLISYLLVVQINPIWTQALNNFNKLCQTGLREDNSNYIYCARKNLKQIPKFTTKLTTTHTVYDEIVLSENQIEVIDEKSFDENFKVRKIYLDLNPIRSIHRNAFDNVKNYLEELYIDLGNFKYDSDYASIDYLQVFTESIFDRCTNLRSLSIKNFNLSSIKASVFRKLTKLTSLSLSNCNLNQLTDKAFIGLEQTLVELNLDSNLFEQLPIDAIGPLKNLKRLNLAQNRLRTFDSLAGLANLNYLDLSFNFIRHFEIQQANKLRSLNLKNNNLNFVDFSGILRSFDHLETLNFDFNKFSQLGGTVSISQTNANQRLTTTIETISLQGCGINANILQDFRQIQFKSLKTLNLARNRLTSIALGNITSLESLTMDKNPLRLQANSFTGLEMSLKSLSLNSIHMQLNEIKYLSGLQRLEYLKLSGNGLNDDDNHNDNDITFDPNMANLRSLTQIDLQNNNLKNLPRFICTLTSLNDLDVNTNRLEGLSETCLKSLLNSNLKQINLNNNPLKCDCKLRYLREWLSLNYAREFLDLFKWECNEPSHLKTHLFTSLNPDDFLCQKDDLVVGDKRRTTSTRMPTHSLVYDNKRIFDDNTRPMRVQTSTQNILLNNETYFYISIGILFGLLTVFLSIVLLIYSICTTKNLNRSKTTIIGGHSTTNNTSSTLTSVDFNNEDLYNTIDSSIGMATSNNVLRKSTPIGNNRPPPPPVPLADCYYKTVENHVSPIGFTNHPCDNNFDCSTEYGYYYKIPFEGTLERDNIIYGYEIEKPKSNNNLFAFNANRGLSYYF